jgi:hypothetical protein
MLHLRSGSSPELTLLLRIEISLVAEPFGRGGRHTCEKISLGTSMLQRLGAPVEHSGSSQRKEATTCGFRAKRSSGCIPPSCGTADGNWPLGLRFSEPSLRFERRLRWS